MSGNLRHTSRLKPLARTASQDYHLACVSQRTDRPPPRARSPAEAKSTMTQRGIPVIALLVLGTGVGAHFLWGFADSDLSGQAWGSDDAYISFRYAENLAQGRGLVFNPSERVEGFSNLLHVLLAAALISIQLPNIYLCVTLLNGFFAACAALLFHRFMQRETNPPSAALAMLLLCASPLVWLWTASGMETALVLLLQLGLWIGVTQIREEWSARGMAMLALVVVTTVLSRADGFVFALITCAYLFLCGPLRGAALALTATCLAMAGTFGWRWTYYGELLPNPYYAKVSGPLAQRLLTATEQLSEMWLRDGLLLYLVALAGFGALLLWRRRLELLRRISSRLLAGIRGDVMDERFVLILVPMGIAAALRTSALLGMRRAWPVALAIAIVQFVPFAFDARFAYQRDKYDRWTLLGRFLGEHHAGALLAIDAAGKVPFLSKLETIDMLGLNDPVIARSPAHVGEFVGHTKYDAEYVLSRSPELIAAWGDRNGNLAWGLRRDLYRAHGYRIRYLVNTTPISRGPNIIDLDNTGLRSREWIRKGYDYVVLERSREGKKR